MCLFVCMQRGEVKFGYLPYSLSTYFGGPGLSLNLELGSQLEWLASKPWDPPVSAPFPRAWVTHTHCHSKPLCTVNIWTQGLMLAQQHFFTHVPRPANTGIFFQKCSQKHKIHRKVLFPVIRKFELILSRVHRKCSSITCLKKSIWGPWDGWVGKGICHRAWRPELVSNPEPTRWKNRTDSQRLFSGYHLNCSFTKTNLKSQYKRKMEVIIRKQLFQ